MKELAAATMMIGAAATESLLEYKFGCCCWSRLLSVVRSSPGILRANRVCGRGFLVWALPKTYLHRCDM
jgi:hypothetical protein